MKALRTSQHVAPPSRSILHVRKNERLHRKEHPLTGHVRGKFSPAACSSGTGLTDADRRRQTRHAASRYTLRLHRARSVVLSAQELVEVRAAQRTFEGAYVRTALGQFSFSLVVLKIFTAEFYSIGALYAVFGAGILAVSAFRRMQGNRQFFSEVGADGLSRKRSVKPPSSIARPRTRGGGAISCKKVGTDPLQYRFRTSGNVVVALTFISLAAYVTLFVLTVRL